MTREKTHTMDTTALRSAYDNLLETAARPDLGEAADQGWNADQILAHLLSVDATVAAVALSVVAGGRPTFDNRICLDGWNLDRIITAHTGRPALIDHVRRQARTLAAIADDLSPEDSAVLVPAFAFSNDVLVLDQPVPLGGLIDGLADNHVPAHAQQLSRLIRSETRDAAQAAG
jgi:hypothetical protein